MRLSIKLKWHFFTRIPPHMDISRSFAPFFGKAAFHVPSFKPIGLTLKWLPMHPVPLTLVHTVRLFCSLLLALALSGHTEREREKLLSTPLVTCHTSLVPTLLERDGARFISLAHTSNFLGRVRKVERPKKGHKQRVPKYSNVTASLVHTRWKSKCPLLCSTYSMDFACMYHVKVGARWGVLRILDYSYIYSPNEFGDL